MSTLVEKNSNGFAKAERGGVCILPCWIMGNSNEGVSLWFKGQPIVRNAENKLQMALQRPRGVVTNTFQHMLFKKNCSSSISCAMWGSVAYKHKARQGLHQPARGSRIGGDVPPPPPPWSVSLPRKQICVSPNSFDVWVASGPCKRKQRIHIRGAQSLLQEHARHNKACQTTIKRKK